MRKIIVSNYMTLDGYFAGPSGEIDWFLWDDETASYSKELIGGIDTMLFGRVTYETMASFWPTATTEDPAITSAMNEFPKIVFSTTLKSAGWNNSSIVRDVTKEGIRSLKNMPGKDLVIFGSGGLVASLAQIDMIDEFRLMVNPVVVGEGKSMFAGLKGRLDLDLLKTRTFRCGIVLLTYRPAGTKS
ncbi:MAG: dihydrofolate reductase [Spirochaetes bacterium]|nr:MAG: dihydrofolate reductase [Spirochaetota bacterium]